MPWLCPPGLLLHKSMNDSLLLLHACLLNKNAGLSDPFLQGADRATAAQTLQLGIHKQLQHGCAQTALCSCFPPLKWQQQATECKRFFIVTLRGTRQHLIPILCAPPTPVPTWECPLSCVSPVSCTPSPPQWSIYLRIRRSKASPLCRILCAYDTANSINKTLVSAGMHLRPQVSKKEGRPPRFPLLTTLPCTYNEKIFCLNAVDHIVNVCIQGCTLQVFLAQSGDFA